MTYVVRANSSLKFLHKLQRNNGDTCQSDSYLRICMCRLDDLELGQEEVDSNLNRKWSFFALGWFPREEGGRDEGGD